MSHILLIYASMTGNTEEMAEAVAEGIQSRPDIVLDKIDVFDEPCPEVEKYDVLAIGTYTWGDGDMPHEFLDFYDELEKQNLRGKLAFCFGSGDTSYETFCGAVRLFEDQLKQSGAAMPFPSLQTDDMPDMDDLERCRQFGGQIVALAAAPRHSRKETD